jgi:hypothetical protein
MSTAATLLICWFCIRINRIEMVFYQGNKSMSCTRQANASDMQVEDIDGKAHYRALRLDVRATTDEVRKVMTSILGRKDIPWALCKTVPDWVTKTSRCMIKHYQSHINFYFKMCKIVGPLYCSPPRISHARMTGRGTMDAFPLPDSLCHDCTCVISALRAI